jgi:hypothetical protein
MKRLFFSIGVMALCCAPAYAQQPTVATGLSPAPIWPASGIIPPQMSDRYVFFDPPANQLVLYYPENLGQADFQTNPGSMRLERIELRDKVQPSVSVNVLRQGGAFVYDYQIANGAGAKQAIARLELVGREMPGDGVMKAPPRWGQAVAAAATNTVSVKTLGFPLGKRMSWQVSGAGIAPGQALSGFQATSTLLPGITVIQVGAGGSAGLRKDLPSAVREQAAPMIRPGNNQQTVYTIGPRYSSDDFMLQRVVQFQSSLSRMIRSGALDANSPAIAEAMQVLESYSRAAAQQPNVPLDTWTGPPLVFTAVARPGIETEIVNALKMSLR